MADRDREALERLLRDDDQEAPLTDVPLGPFDGYTPEDAYREGHEDARREISRSLRAALASDGAQGSPWRPWREDDIDPVRKVLAKDRRGYRVEWSDLLHPGSYWMPIPKLQEAEDGE